MQRRRRHEHEIRERRGRRKATRQNICSTEEARACKAAETHICAYVLHEEVL